MRLLSRCSTLADGHVFRGVVSGANKSLVCGKLSEFAGEFRPPPSDNTRPTDDHSTSPGASSHRLVVISTHEQVDPTRTEVWTAAVRRRVSRQTPDEQLLTTNHAWAAHLENLQYVDSRPRPISQSLFSCHLCLKRYETTSLSFAAVSRIWRPIFYLYSESFHHVLQLSGYLSVRKLATVVTNRSIQYQSNKK